MDGPVEQPPHTHDQTLTGPATPALSSQCQAHLSLQMASPQLLRNHQGRLTKPNRIRRLIGAELWCISILAIRLNGVNECTLCSRRAGAKLRTEAEEFVLSLLNRIGAAASEHWT